MKCSIRLLLSALFFQLSALPLAACPLCKDAITTIDGLAKGITWGIALMLAVPILVLGSIATIIVFAHRKQVHRLNTSALH